MNQQQIVGFIFSKIVTDDFTITGEPFDPALETNLNVGLSPGFNPDEQMIGIKVQCNFIQRDRIVLVIAITCLFKIVPEHWANMYNLETNTLTVSNLPALHFGSLTVSTTRGVLFGKTEGTPFGSLIIPPINIGDFIKGDLVLNPASLPQHA